MGIGDWGLFGFVIIVYFFYAYFTNNDLQSLIPSPCSPKE